MKSEELRKVFEEYKTSKLVLSKEDIKDGIYRIVDNLRDKGDVFTVIGIITGGVPFSLDLSKELSNSNKLVIYKTISIQLYGNNRHINPNVILSNPEKYIKFHNISNDVKELSDCIIICDDICDTGTTLKLAKDLIKAIVNNNDISVYTATVINTVDSNDKVYNPDFYIHKGSVNNWYFGYGMDLRDGLYREIDEIRIVNR